MGTAAILLDGQEMISDPRNPTPATAASVAFSDLREAAVRDGGNLKATALEATYGSIGGAVGWMQSNAAAGSMGHMDSGQSAVGAGPLQQPFNTSLCSRECWCC